MTSIMPKHILITVMVLALRGGGLAGGRGVRWWGGLRAPEH